LRMVLVQVKVRKRTDNNQHCAFGFQTKV